MLLEILRSTKPRTTSSLIDGLAKGRAYSKSHPTALEVALRALHDRGNLVVDIRFDCPDAELGAGEHAARKAMTAPGQTLHRSPSTRSSAAEENFASNHLSLRLPELVVSTVTFREFEADARARGFDEVLERNWAPLTVLDTHVHAFAVKALVVRGEMWLSVGNDTRHLRAGDAFELERDVPHAERYGSEGATYWVARRNVTRPT